MSEVVMPRLSDTMEEGELARWLKNVGDPVHKGDVLAEIETDKATMDLEAFEDGILEQQLVEAGAVVPIGQPLAIIGDGSGSKAPAVKAPAKPVAAVVAEPVAAATAVPVAAASAATQAEVPAPADTPATASAVPHQIEGRLRASPLARMVAHEHGLDVDDIVGTGPQGRVVRADVEEAIAHSSAASTSAPAAAQSAVVRPVATSVDDEEIPLGNIRKVTARRLTESQAVPHFFLTSVVNVEKLIGLRADANAALEAKGVKVSLNDFLVAAAAVALREHPDANSSWGGDRLLRHGHVNIGIAVATDAGLVVPVVADADRLSLSQIAQTTAALAAKAREGKLALADMSGGTFTISNLGMFGIDQFTAVINPPEAAILAVGAALPVPVLRDGMLVEVPKMSITLTADHRVLDGATAAAFLRSLTAILEQPLRLVL
jgi:pyruvate dehydrogenase E2 component (dihydrolipoamide acetyltransferase)